MTIMLPFILLILRVTGAVEPMRIIGAGFSMTGTSSLKLALGTLGYKTYDLTSMVMGTPRHTRAWSNTSEAALDATLDLLASEGFNATVGFPACAFYDRILARYPSAKVILTAPRTPNKWKDAFLRTQGTAPYFLDKTPWSFIFPGLSLSLLNSHEKVGFEARVTQLRPEPIIVNAVPTQRKWVEQVKHYVPKQQLLIFNNKLGWAHLCEFLGLIDKGCPSSNVTAFPEEPDDKVAWQLITIVCTEIAKWWHTVWPIGALAMLSCIVPTMTACCRQVTHKHKDH